MTSVDAINEARGLAVLLHRAAALAREDFARAAERFGIAPPAARVLLLLDDPMPMRKIADRLLVDASYVTGVADQLEEAGLATRGVGEDRRVKLLSATESGADVRERLAVAISADFTALHALDDAERAQLATLLERLVESGAR
ncbi:MarR family winged helix-turn-helix transcriptional regulator [Agrococcus terreus]|uniref:MarR family transcriptional regulator n=1 Tax=Agrococcus terreus TaxID=574649 RepID=A0ABQ2KCZ6_9MICO|nr:MarR family transcriptional regulator [Agrococcus terreus]GGN77920.1 MarR family transcriptional regulator [Agrococcus terreus]